MIKKNILIFLIIFVVIIFQSCENLNDPGNIELNNSALLNLRTGNCQQQLFVYNSLPLSYQFNDPPPFTNTDEAFAENAKITISENDNNYDNFQIAYVDSNNRKRCYTNSEELIIDPYKEYSIKVESNGQIITGKIITIGDFEILNINQVESEDSNRFNFNVSWTKCPGARFYEVKTTYFYIDSVIISFKDGQPIWDLANLIRTNLQYVDPDTIVKSNNEYSLKTIISNNSDSMIVEVGAYDNHTYNYLFEKIKKVNIENAYGYLGSSTIKSKKLILTNKSH